MKKEIYSYSEKMSFAAKICTNCNKAMTRTVGAKLEKQFGKYIVAIVLKTCTNYCDIEKPVRQTRGVEKIKF